MHLCHLKAFTLLALAAVLSSCGEEDRTAPAPSYAMGERVVLGHLTYVVYETQWLTQLGDGADAHVPQNRFFLVRLSAANGAGKEVTVPNFTLEDDNGNSYPEIGGDRAQGVPQYIGYLRRVKPANSVQGHALFDVPPRHYKLKLMDEDSEKSAYVDIPLSFTSETPELPQVANPRADQPLPVTPKKK